MKTKTRWVQEPDVGEFSATGLAIEPYHKKPRMLNESMVELDDSRRFVVPATLLTAKYFDFVWMCSLAIHLENTAMWTGWNSKLATNSLPMQKIGYLRQLNVSPTSTSAVMETMKISQRIAEECDQQYISVTYDLAIAKIALCEQAEEKPTFDNLFIHLRFFHV